MFTAQREEVCVSLCVCASRRAGLELSGYIMRGGGGGVSCASKMIV